MMARYGIGSGTRGGTTATRPAPLAPSSGSGGAGSLRVPGLSFAPAMGELSDVTTGRITLSIVNLTLLAMIAFYIATRAQQGGG